MNSNNKYGKIKNSSIYDSLCKCLKIVEYEYHTLLEKENSNYNKHPKLINDLPFLNQKRENIKKQQVQNENLEEQKLKILEEEKEIKSEMESLRQTGYHMKSKDFLLTEEERGLIPKLPKTHHDYMLQEMAWMATDFDNEKQWKFNVARNLCSDVRLFFYKKKKREHLLKNNINPILRSRAIEMAKEVHSFFGNIEKMVTQINENKLKRIKKRTVSSVREKTFVEKTKKITELISQSMDEKTSKQEENNNNQIKKKKQNLKETLEGISENKNIENASKEANSIIPKGYTYQDTKIKTKIPNIFSNSPAYHLREYQHIGLDWLVTMHDKGLNGILADEMGLGKTIQTIALIAHLAYEKQIWGQHLVVVPSSVVLNWEIEFKRWCPYLKVLSYYGDQKQRKEKRKGWNNPNTFNVCITSYSIIMRDIKAFRRKNWYYLILDEAQNIKNFRSSYWQKLLVFKSNSRLLLTGTPLQNSLMELWALMHFLMPHVFESHEEFKEWFSNPLEKMASGDIKVNNKLIEKLHTILRPFILRRMKSEVEKQLPNKNEKVMYCKLSKRQNYLYEEYMQRTKTKETVKSGNVFKIIGVIMQLRKVCNHPDLFEERETVTPFDVCNVDYLIPTLILSLKKFNVDLSVLGLSFIENEFLYSQYDVKRIEELQTPDEEIKNFYLQKPTYDEFNPFLKEMYKRFTIPLFEKRMQSLNNRKDNICYLQNFSCKKHIIFGKKLIDMCKINVNKKIEDITEPYNDIVKSATQRSLDYNLLFKSICIYVPKARAKKVDIYSPGEGPNHRIRIEMQEKKIIKTLSNHCDILRVPFVRRQMFFPDRRLLIYDSGKLLALSTLLKQLKSEKHRVLIFTQMTKVLNLLEKFLCIYGYSYFRLDGKTPIEERQYMTEKFNSDKNIFVFILSTRTGGLGVNLTGADTVIFYDSDWNPAMDAQAQDRCHRIGQTKNVTIYRLITKNTIEEKILEVSNSKKKVNELVITQGKFTSDFFKKVDFKSFFNRNENNSASSIINNDVNDDLMDLDEDRVNRAFRNVEDEEDQLALRSISDEIIRDHGEIIDKKDELENKIITELKPIERFVYKEIKNKQSSYFNQKLKSFKFENEKKEFKRIKFQKKYQPPLFFSNFFSGFVARLKDPDLYTPKIDLYKKISKKNNKRKKDQLTNRKEKKRKIGNRHTHLEWTKLEDEALLNICEKYNITIDNFFIVDWFIVSEELSSHFYPFTIGRHVGEIKKRFKILKEMRKDSTTSFKFQVNVSGKKVQNLIFLASETRKYLKKKRGNFGIDYNRYPGQRKKYRNNDDSTNLKTNFIKSETYGNPEIVVSNFIQKKEEKVRRVSIHNQKNNKKVLSSFGNTIIGSTSLTFNTRKKIASTLGNLAKSKNRITNKNINIQKVNRVNTNYRLKNNPSIKIQNYNKINQYATVIQKKKNNGINNNKRPNGNITLRNLQVDSNFLQTTNNEIKKQLMKKANSLHIKKQQQQQQQQHQHQKQQQINNYKKKKINGNLSNKNNTSNISSLRNLQVDSNFLQNTGDDIKKHLMKKTSTIQIPQVIKSNNIKKNYNNGNNSNNNNNNNAPSKLHIPFVQQSFPFYTSGQNLGRLTPSQGFIKYEKILNPYFVLQKNNNNSKKGKVQKKIIMKKNIKK